MMIQSGSVKLNGQVEERRAKKLFLGDIVEVEGVEVDVGEEVDKRDYVWKVKEKKEKEDEREGGRKEHKSEDKEFKGEVRRATRSEMKAKL